MAFKFKSERLPSRPVMAKTRSPGNPAAAAQSRDEALKGREGSLSDLNLDVTKME